MCLKNKSDVSKIYIFKVYINDNVYIRVIIKN